MAKIYDNFVKKNPSLFKISTLDLFVRVGFLSQDVYVEAKSSIEAQQKALKEKEELAASASAEQKSLAEQSAAQSNAESASESTNEEKTSNV